MSALISVKRGSVYLPIAVYETYFKDIDAIIVLIREGALNILPVQHVSAGGCLLKIRNAQGDRVAAAQDVFAANNLADWTCDGLEVSWDPAQAALVGKLPSNYV